MPQINTVKTMDENLKSNYKRTLNSTGDFPKISTDTIILATKNKND
jgi:hypothetical protein